MLYILADGLIHALDRSIEKDLDVKRNSLLIDRDRCLKARTMFPSTNLLCGYRNASTALNQL